MKHYLVLFDENWADEMDISGFIVCDESMKNQIELLENYHEQIHVSIGTNEDLTYNNGKEFLEAIEIKELAQQEFETMNKLFGDSTGDDFYHKKLSLMSQNIQDQIIEDDEKWEEFKKEADSLTLEERNEILDKVNENEVKLDIYYNYMMEKGEEDEWLEDVQKQIEFVDNMDEETKKAFTSVSSYPVLTYGFGDIIERILESIK